MSETIWFRIFLLSEADLSLLVSSVESVSMYLLL